MWCNHQMKEIIIQQPVSKGKMLKRKEKHQRRRTKHVHKDKREEGSVSSTETDDSSPHCDIMSSAFLW